MTKPILPFVETMITQACNISCTGCTNYSDLAHKGYVTWSQGKNWLETWLTRIDIPDFGIMGGEPLLNPEVNEWIQGIRKILPQAQIRFTTNGILLKNHLDIIKLLEDVGNCVFKITVHTKDDELENIIEKLFIEYKWEPVLEYGVHRFKTKNNFRLQINRPQTFIKTFKGPYHDMMPYDSSPDEAFKICCQPQCPLLFNGRIYKCSSNGLLQNTLESFGFPNYERWNKYIDTGIGPDCNDNELDLFIKNFGKSHKVCGMCPSSSNIESQINHTETVLTNKIRFKQ